MPIIIWYIRLTLPHPHSTHTHRCKLAHTTHVVITNHTIYTLITSRFCAQNRDDCLELLSTCLDWTNSAPGLSANALCARLSPDSGPCVPLGAFAELGASRLPPPRLQHDRQTELQHTAIDLPEVTTPCKRNPCAPGSVCLVNRGCRIGRGCKPYRCVAGCKAGEVSHFLVPEDSYARIPTFNGQKGCVKICLCTKKGIEKCQQVPCSQMQSCWLVGKPIGEILYLLQPMRYWECIGGDDGITLKYGLETC